MPLFLSNNNGGNSKVVQTARVGWGFVVFALEWLDPENATTAPCLRRRRVVGALPELPRENIG